MYIQLSRSGNLERRENEELFPADWMQSHNSIGFSEVGVLSLASCCKAHCAPRLLKMRKVICFIVSTALSACLMADTRTLNSLTDLRWKHRIILVDEATDRTVSELEAQRAGVDERQILWFCVLNGEVRSNYDGALEGGFLARLREDYFERTGFPVLLIGKDGGIKSRDTSLDIEDYFVKIDAMPMRQTEMAGSDPD